MVVTTVTVKRKLWPKLQLDLWRQIDRYLYITITIYRVFPANLQKRI